VLVVTSLLLLAAAGLLAAALITGPMWLAWASIAASAAAALALVVRWWRLRRARGRHRAVGEAPVQADPPQRTAEPATARPDSPPPDEAEPGEPEPRTAEAGNSEPGKPEPGVTRQGGAAARRQHREPVEEDTDAADLLLVCELTDEVLVVDERPRYHLAGCRWLGSKPTEPLPVKEARELGFTPCVSCGPDAELARRHRAASTG
jgi:hypothetical protein